MEIDWEKVDSMGPDEIENLRVEKLKELNTMEEEASIVKDNLNAKGREILFLEIEKKDLSTSYSKARQNIKMLKTDIEILQTKFWKSRR